MKRLWISSLLLACLPSAAWADLERQVGSARLNWSQGQMTVTGTGARKAGGNPGQQRLLAQRAAIVDAYRQLAEAVNGVQVFSETTVENYVVSNDLIKLQVSAVVRGAKIQGPTRYLSDDTVEVDVSLPIFGAGSVAEAINFGTSLSQFEQSLKLPFRNLNHYLAYHGTDLSGLQHSETNATSPSPSRGYRLAKNNKPYTGLIINAQGLAAEPAMGPFIIGAGKRLHPTNLMGIDPELVVKKGPLHYVEDLDEAMADTEQVGDNPLVVEAKAAVGEPIHCNILLDEPTALKVLDINQQANYLENLKVTLVL